MNILLIGHRGYLGEGMMNYLNPRHRVVGWDKEEDLFKLDAKILARKKIDLLINLSVAADRKSSTFIVDGASDKVIVDGARHIARVLQGTDIKWIQMSTREVYGIAYGPKDIVKTKQGYRPKFLMDENFHLAPVNCYGKAKLMSEFISESHPFSNVIRLSTCYTDFDHPLSGNWILQMIKSALQGKTITLAGGGHQFRDPMHVNDLGRLIELLAEKNVHGEKINAAGGRSNFISLREFMLRSVPKVKLDKAPGGDLGFALDIRKAFRLTGWKPRVDFRKKLPVIVSNIERNLGSASPLASWSA